MEAPLIIPSQSILKKLVLRTLALIVGEERAKVIKQKWWLKRAQNPPPTVTSREERAIFEALKDRYQVVFEVGIQNDLSFVKMKKDCAYHLFEPNQKFLKMIRRQLLDMSGYNIVLNEFGLSDRPAENMVYYEKSQSFVVNKHYTDGDIDTGQRYPLRTLDEYVASNNIQKIDLLKIDTEGFDYNIILGGMKTIRSNKVPFIQFEHWGDIRKFHNLLKDVFDLYAIIEPRLLKTIQDRIIPIMTIEEKSLDFTKSLVPLDEKAINLFDTKINPTGAGCNIFGINRAVKDVDLRKLTLSVQPL